MKPQFTCIKEWFTILELLLTYCFHTLADNIRTEVALYKNVKNCYAKPKYFICTISYIKYH